MATLKNVIFGFPAGKAGDIIFKVRNGKPYFCLKPSFVTIKDTFGSRKAKGDFAFASSLASAVNKVKLFSNAWGSYNKIIKMNYPVIKESRSIERILLVPGGGEFEFKPANIALNSDEVTIEIPKPEKVYPYGTTISVQGVMHLSSPADENLKPDLFIPLISRNYDYEDNAILVKILFTSVEVEKIRKYSSYIININAALRKILNDRVLFSEGVVVKSH
jgi:hypothetical protein